MSKNENMTEQEIEQYVKSAAVTLEDQRATEIEILHVAKLTTMADYFILCTGGSTTHIRSLSEAVEHDMETKYGLRPHHIEGYSAANWILMDYQDIIIHIFDKENRLFYDLDRIWRDGKIVTKEDLQ